MRAIFFDLDGTLVDTEGVAMDVTREWLGRNGYRTTGAAEKAIVGKTWALASTILVRELEIKMPAAELEATLVRAYRERTARGLKILPGAAAFVRAVSKSYRTFVVSGSPRQDIQHALDAMGVADCIERYYGASDYPRSKPAPDPYLTALAGAGLSAHQALVFEDSEAGIASAEAAGLRVVVVTGAQVLPVDGGTHECIRDFEGLDTTWVAARFDD